MTTRGHFVNDTAVDSAAPKALTKEEFGRRLHRKLTEKGWRQADLVRASGVVRSSISAYLNGHQTPTSANLHAIAKALGTTPEDLLPNYAKANIEADRPSFEIRASSGDPLRPWVILNRRMTMGAAAKIATIVEEDAAVLEGQ